MKIKSWDVILACAVVLGVISGFAHTWQQTNPTLNYGSVGMSADGRIICALPSGTRPVFSTNSGNTWVTSTNNQHGGSLYLGGVAMSADGSLTYAALNSSGAQLTAIWVSPDQGTNWTQTAFPVTTTSTNYCVACSADGTKVIAALGHGPIFYSTNGGVNCYTSSVAPANWTSVASSADGSRMVAGANGGKVYFSQDFGANWTAANLPVDTWNSVCASVDGKSIGAVSGLRSYISADFGATWITNNFAGRSIVCSANGAVWLVTSTQIETSIDGGHTWQANLASAQWNSGAVSADGNLMVVSGTPQGTWIGRLTPSPLLNIQSQDPNVTLSWLIPSTNFILQQTADLSNPAWTPVAISPTLNFTNLQQEVSVPANGSNAFFRLTAQ